MHPCALAARGASYKTFEGVGFSFSHDTDLEVLETSNGRVYRVEVRRANRADVHDPLALLVMVPDKRVAPERVTEGLLEEMTARFRALLLSPIEGERVTRTLAGRTRTGRSIVWERVEGRPVYVSELFAWRNGESVAAVLTKVDQGDSGVGHRQVDQVLDSLQAHPWDAAGRRVHRLGDFSLSVPVLTQMQIRRSLDEGRLYRFEWPRGRIEAMVSDAPDQRRRQTEAWVERLGDRIEHRDIARWFGQEVVEGEAMLIEAWGRQREVQVWYVPSRHSVLTLRVVFAKPSGREALLRQLHDICKSLKVEPCESQRLQEFIGHGFGVKHPPQLSIRDESKGWGSHTTFRPKWDPDGSTRFWLELRRDIDTDCDLMPHMAVLLLEHAAVLGQELAEPQIRAATFLGEECRGLAARTTGDAPLEVHVYPCVLDEGVAMAGLVTRVVDAGHDLVTFKTLLDHTSWRSHGVRRIATEQFAFDYLSSDWRVQRIPKQDTESGTGCLEIRLSGDHVQATFWSDAIPLADRLDTLTGVSLGEPRPYLAGRTQLQAEALAREDETQFDWQIETLPPEQRPLAGTIAFTAGYVRHWGERRERVTVFTLGLKLDTVTVVTYWPETQTSKALAELRPIFESLEVFDPLPLR